MPSREEHIKFHSKVEVHRCSLSKFSACGYTTSICPKHYSATPTQLTNFLKNFRRTFDKCSGSYWCTLHPPGGTRSAHFLAVVFLTSWSSYGYRRVECGRTGILLPLQWLSIHSTTATSCHRSSRSQSKCWLGNSHLQLRE